MAQRGSGDGVDRVGGKDRLVDLVKDLQPLGVTAQRLLGALPLGDVLEHGHAAGGPGRAIADRRRADQEVAPLPIGPFGAYLHVSHGLARSHRLQQGRQSLPGEPTRRILGRALIVTRAGAGEKAQFLGGAVGQHDAPALVRDDDRLGRVGDDGMQARPLRCQQVQQALALRHIQQREDQPTRLAVGAGDGRQPPIPIGGAKFGTVRIREGLGAKADRLAGVARALENRLVLGVWKEVKVVATKQLLTPVAAPPCIGRVHAHETKVGIEEGELSLRVLHHDLENIALVLHTTQDCPSIGHRAGFAGRRRRAPGRGSGLRPHLADQPADIPRAA